MLDLTLRTVLLRLAALLVIAAVHGFAACAAARLLGDRGPTHDGRLTLNPAAHIDLFGALALIVAGMGWVRPLQLEPAELRPNRFAVALVPAAAIAATLGAAVALAWVLPFVATAFSDATALPVMAFIVVFVRASIGFAVLNILPLPPLSGGYLLDAAWPPAAAQLRKRQTLIGAALLVLLATGIADPLFAPPANGIARLILGDLVTADAWR